MQPKNESIITKGNRRFCPGCVWWELEDSIKDSKVGLLDRAVERASEVFRLLIILITSVVAFSLFWKNKWGKLHVMLSMKYACNELYYSFPRRGR